jgi:hypothetical protein
MKKIKWGSFCLVVFLALLGTSGLAATWYVSPSGNDVNNGTSWALAKQSIQAAVDVATGQDLILVTNGVYSPIFVDKATLLPSLTIQSVNGPAVTTIDGGGVSRCVELASDVTLSGFTLTNGFASIGGGVYMHGGGTVTNCVISGNTATSDGGGAYVTTPDGHAALARVVNSTIRGNIAYDRGGGAFLVRGLSSGTLQNSIISDNLSSEGGGVLVGNGCFVRNCLIMGNAAAATYGGGVTVQFGGRLENSTIVGNTANTTGGGVIVPNGGTVLNCIIYYNENTDMWGPVTNSLYGTGSSTSGTGNITNSAPLFVSTGSGFGAGHAPGDYRLTSESPAINAGQDQGWMSGAVDLAGNPRINGTTVDMGAYEFTAAGKLSQTITFPAIANRLTTDTVTLSATASSGLPVSFSVVSGPASISGGTTLSFSGAGTVSVRASQAGNATYDPAPNVTRTFQVSAPLPSGAFTLRAVALTDSVVLRWPSPGNHGFDSETVQLRFSADDYPGTPTDGTSIYQGSDRVYTHTGRTPGTTYYYSIFTSNDGTTFIDPNQ